MINSRMYSFFQSVQERMADLIGNDQSLNTSYDDNCNFAKGSGISKCSRAMAIIATQSHKNEIPESAVIALFKALKPYHAIRLAIYTGSFSELIASGNFPDGRLFTSHFSLFEAPSFTDPLEIKNYTEDILDFLSAYHGGIEHIPLISTYELIINGRINSQVMFDYMIKNNPSAFVDFAFKIADLIDNGMNNSLLREILDSLISNNKVSKLLASGIAPSYKYKGGAIHLITGQLNENQLSKSRLELLCNGFEICASLNDILDGRVEFDVARNFLNFALSTVVNFKKINEAFSLDDKATIRKIIALAYMSVNDIYGSSPETTRKIANIGIEGLSFFSRNLNLKDNHEFSRAITQSILDNGLREKSAEVISNLIQSGFSKDILNMDDCIKRKVLESSLEL